MDGTRLAVHPAGAICTSGGDSRLFTMKPYEIEKSLSMTLI
jgi:hypothetical protein